MTVHDEILALCAELAEQGVKVTQKAIIDRRGGSKRDVSRAVREFHALQQRNDVGQPVLPEIKGRLDNDTITGLARLMEDIEDLYILSDPTMQSALAKLFPERHPKPDVRLMKAHIMIEGSDFAIPCTPKSAIIILAPTSLTTALDHWKGFAAAAKIEQPVLIIQAVPFMIPDLPQSVQLHSLGLDDGKDGPLLRLFLTAALAEILLAVRQLREGE